ncbi:MAG: hypothetical protein IT539_09095 [Bradyrhizobiaceae bacterium]|nr:hypothetical protein [Bradyrhizobiaceae bacterium]
MKLAFLMIILTLLKGGEMSVAFVNTQTLEECEKRAAVVRTILEKGGVTIEHLVCRASEVQFEPFVHGMEDDAERQAYLVSFDDKTATVEPIASCEAAGAPRAARYCATSTQKLLPQPR